MDVGVSMRVSMGSLKARPLPGASCRNPSEVIGTLVFKSVLNSITSARNGPSLRNTRRGGADRLPGDLPFGNFVALKTPISSLPGFNGPRNPTCFTRCPVLFS